MPNEADDDLLWRYLDGELAAREHALVEKKLINDPAWRERLETLRAEDEIGRAAILELGLAERARRLADAVRAEIDGQDDDETPDPVSGS
ncbi:MAG: hypothetical protein H6807_02090 [Planctomycetes bacterium]|nr:hypothetical protein [Planctomycetota bacterium]